jgi:hypothetical protein
MDTSNHANSKKITIFRTDSLLSKAQTADTKDFLATTKVSVGSYYENRDSRKIASGLTSKEERLLMPEFIDADPEEREYRTKLADFFTEIDTEIPYEKGKILEIGLEESNDREVSKDNLPLNKMDFIRWRHAQGHPFMATSKEEGSSNPTKQYYIFDPSSVQDKKKKKSAAQNDALKTFLSIKDTPEKVDMMLTLLGVDPREFFGADIEEQKSDALKELATKKYDEFNKITIAGDLDKRYWIQTMVKLGIIKQLGTKYSDSETKKLIGNSLEETIAYFSDEDNNSDHIAMYKARMQEALKKPFKPGSKKTTPLAGKELKD